MKKISPKEIDPRNTLLLHLPNINTMFAMLASVTLDSRDAAAPSEMIGWGCCLLVSLIYDTISRECVSKWQSFACFLNSEEVGPKLITNPCSLHTLRKRGYQKEIRNSFKNVAQLEKTDVYQKGFHCFRFFSSWGLHTHMHTCTCKHMHIIELQYKLLYMCLYMCVCVDIYRERG